MPPAILLSTSLTIAVMVAPAAAAPATGGTGTVTRYVAIDNVCAWPMVNVLPDRTLAVIIHNRPSHGSMEGDVECWASKEGAVWEKRGHPAPNDPETVRMNVAAGLTRAGELIVLCSGWSNIKQPERPKQARFRDAILPIWICRSKDGGRTWTQQKTFATPPAGWTEYIPFGPIVAGSDGALHTTCYAGEFVDPTVSTKTKAYRAWHFRSDDDGQTWRPTSVIGPTHSETALLHLGGRKWLAAARGSAMDLFRSDDDGATWVGPQRVTGRNEINGHLLRLRDGRVVLSYGNRVAGQFGVMAKVSADDGATWSEPWRLATSLDLDCGYPSSVQRSDGKVVTVHYARRVENHERYHMGSAIWEVPRNQP